MFRTEPLIAFEADKAEFSDFQWGLLIGIVHAAGGKMLHVTEDRANRLHGTLPHGELSNFETAYAKLELPVSGLTLHKAWAEDTSILATVFFKAVKNPGGDWSVERRERTVAPDEALFSSWEALPVRVGTGPADLSTKGIAA